MPQVGGRRPNSGRKAGSVTRKTREIAERAAAEGITPLEYMLKLMRDANQTATMRFEAAKASAPFIHPRLAAIEHSGNLAVTHEQALAELENDDDTHDDAEGEGTSEAPQN